MGPRCLDWRVYFHYGGLWEGICYTPAWREVRCILLYPKAEDLLFLDDPRKHFGIGKGADGGDGEVVGKADG